jgi:hypothetical protein
MIRICMDCGLIIGSKPPLHDNSRTHGICPECLERRREEIRRRAIVACFTAEKQLENEI